MSGISGFFRKLGMFVGRGRFRICAFSGRLPPPMSPSLAASVRYRPAPLLQLLGT